MKPKDFFPRPDVKVAWRRWENTPPLTSLVPLRLGNGYVLDELTVSCPQCKEFRAHGNMRGELQSINEGGFQLKTILWCSGCNLLSYTRADILPKGDRCVIYKDETPPYWSPWGEDNASIRGGFGGNNG